MEARGRLVGTVAAAALTLAATWVMPFAPATVSPTWISTTPRHCGHFRGEVAFIDKLETRGVSCRLARRLTRRWFRVSAYPVPHTTSVLGFSCLVLGQDIQYSKVRCLRAPLWVQWESS
jgi:hypothetical protein